MKITIIIPVYNEVNTVDKVINKIFNLKSLNKQIIVVDDGSNDGTTEKLKKRDLSKKVEKIIFHSENKGKGAAIQSAQKYISGQITIIQDADLEYNPNDYFKLIKPFEDEKISVVYGSRVLGKKRYSESDGFISKSRVFFNHALTVFSNIMNGQKLTDAHTCYKVFRSDIFRNIKLKENDFAFCPEVTSKISRLNITILEVPISYKGRTIKEGKKIGLKDGLRAIFVLFKNKIIY